MPWSDRLAPMPVWARALLLAVALLLAGLAFASTESPRLTGYWGTEVTYRGHLEPGANATHALAVLLPDDQSVKGLRFQPGPAAVNFRSVGPLNGTPYRITVLGGRQVFLDRVIDPANPLSAPEGPPISYLPSGEYQLVVRSLGNATDYALRESVSLPFVARQSGVFVDRMVLLAPALLAAAGALTPPWRRMHGPKEGSPPDPSRPAEDVERTYK